MRVGNGISAVVVARDAQGNLIGVAEMYKNLDIRLPVSVGANVYRGIAYDTSSIKPNRDGSINLR